MVSLYIDLVEIHVIDKFYLCLYTPRLFNILVHAMSEEASAVVGDDSDDVAVDVDAESRLLVESVPASEGEAAAPATTSPTGVAIFVLVLPVADAVLVSVAVTALEEFEALEPDVDDDESASAQTQVIPVIRPTD